MTEIYALSLGHASLVSLTSDHETWKVLLWLPTQGSSARVVHRYASAGSLGGNSNV